MLKMPLATASVVGLTRHGVLKESAKAKSTEAPAEKPGEDDRGSCESDQATEEMNVRTLRKLCKEKGLKVQGRKKEVLARLLAVLKPGMAGDDRDGSSAPGQSGKADVVPDKSEDSDVTDEVTDQGQDKDDDVETEEQPVLNLSKKRVAALQRSILEGRRQVNTPERYSPSPASFIYDDDDSNSEGISVDTDASACSLSSDSTEARSTVLAAKKRRRSSNCRDRLSSSCSGETH